MIQLFTLYDVFTLSINRIIFHLQALILIVFIFYDEILITKSIHNEIFYLIRDKFSSFRCVIFVILIFFLRRTILENDDEVILITSTLFYKFPVQLKAKIDNFETTYFKNKQYLSKLFFKCGFLSRFIVVNVPPKL